MTKYDSDVCKEFQNLKQSLIFDLGFFNDNSNEMFRIFKYVYLFNLLRNRVELKNVFVENFDMAYSLLLESTYSLFSGQTRASLFLLRSYQEATLKFVVEQERKWIQEKDPNHDEFETIDYRFSETKRKLIKDLKPYLDSNISKEYLLELDRTESFYKKISGMVHSNSEKIPIKISEYYSNLQGNMIHNKENFFNLYLNTLETMFLIIYFMLRNNFRNWDTYELKSIISIIFRNENRTSKYIEMCKVHR